MKVIAIDPGSIKTGWAFRGTDRVIVSGVFKAPKAWPRAKRIAEITGIFRSMLTMDFQTSSGKEIPHEPFTHMVVEVASNKTYARNRGQGGSMNLQAVYVLGMAAGGLIQTARGQGLGDNIYEATDQEWIGGRKKEQRQQQAVWILGDSGISAAVLKAEGKLNDTGLLKDDNEADAICLLYWYEQIKKEDTP